MLTVSDQAKSKESVQFAVNSDNTALQFVAKKEPKKFRSIQRRSENSRRKIIRKIV
jgi:hypothetical protein